MTDNQLTAQDFQLRVQSAAPEISLCKVTLFLFEEVPAIFISAPARPIGRALWAERSSIEKAAKNSGFSGSIVIQVDGKFCGPPIDV